MIKYIGNALFSEFDTATTQECVEFLKDQEVIGFDVETSRIYPIGQYDESIYKGGLDPYLSRICMVQIGTEEIQYIIDARVVDIRFLKDILENKLILKVGHNLKFDAKHLLKLGIVLNGIHDTFLTERVLRNGYIEQFSLKALAIKYVGAKDVEQVDLFNQIEFCDDEEMEEELVIDKSIRTQFVDIWDNPFTLDQIKYGADDVTFPLGIRDIQIKNKDYPVIGINLENRFVRTLASIEYVGINFDPVKWLDVADSSKIKYSERLAMLNKWVEENHLKFCYHADLFSNEPTCKIQWSSSKQVIELFKYLGICPKEPSKQTKRMEWSVGAKALFKSLPIEYRDRFQEGNDVEKIESLNDFILQYMLLKKTEQACTTFGKDWLKYIHPVTKKVHTNYRQLMNTSRISSTNPNMQNIPSGHQYRECFIGDKAKGKLICASDYEAQESKALADISGVEKMISFFRDGDPIFGSDMHSMSASQMQRVIRKDSTIIVTKKSDPKARNIAKALGFALNKMN